MVTDTYNRALRAMARGAIVVAVGLGTAAVAQPRTQIDVSGHTNLDSETKVRAVRFSDLNLADAHGRTRLDHRLKFASARVCDGFGATWINPPKDYKRCFGSALEGARSQVAERLAAGDTRDIQVASR